jgi:hypothetical protein
MRSLIASVACALAVVSLAVTATAVADGPVGDGLGDVQTFSAAASPAQPSAGIIFDIRTTYVNELGVPALRSPTAVVIHFPRGTVWNGPLFPHCDPAALAARGPAACPPGSEFATAQASAAVGLQALELPASLTEFVGPSLDGLPTQLFYAVPAIGPPFVLTAVVRDDPAGPYGISLDISLAAVPGATPLSGSPIVLVAIHNVDQHTSVVREVGGRMVTTPLIVAPPVCHGSWAYAFDSVFAIGPPLTSTTDQPCSAPS